MMKSRVGYTKIIIVKGAFPYLHLWVNKNVRYVNSGDMNTFELNSYLDAWIRKISQNEFAATDTFTELIELILSVIYNQLVM